MYRFPYPLDKGDKLRAYNQIKYLSRNNDIYLCSILDAPLEESSRNELDKYCKKIFTFNLSRLNFLKNLVKNIFNGRPLQNAYTFDSRIKAEIEQIIRTEKIDIAMCLMVRAADYIADVPIPTTLDYQDVLSKGFQRRAASSLSLRSILYSMEADRLAKYERELFDKFDNKIIITEEDRSFIPHKNKLEIHIIGNGIDTDYFTPTDEDKLFDLLFVGNMQYEPNVVSMLYMAKEILPIIKLSKPDVRLMIAGADPVREILELESDSIKVTGRLEDIRVAYRSGRIFIAPMQLGTGLQNKLLEAMSMKLPVITSELCNKGLKATAGKHLLIGSSANEYAEHCLTLMNDLQKAENLAGEAYSYILDNFSWNSVNAKLEQILKNNL